MNAKTATGVYVALNCDRLAIASSIECLLHASAVMVKNVKLKNHRPFLMVSEIISLCWNNALTEQADVLVAKI